MIPGDAAEGGKHGLKASSLNAFALKEYQKYGTVFSGLTSDDITKLFDLYRDLKKQEYGIRPMRYILFLREIYNSVRMYELPPIRGPPGCRTEYVDAEGVTNSTICRRIISARRQKAAQQGDTLSRISCFDFGKLRNDYENSVQQTRRYKVIAFDSIVSIDTNLARLHIAWTAYWDFQILHPSILYDTVRALTDCDGVSLAVTKELLERDVASDSSDPVLPWYERIVRKPAGETRADVYPSGELVEGRDQGDSRETIRYVDHLADIESKDGFGCRSLAFPENQALKIAAQEDGEIVFKHNRHLLGMKVPADRFLTAESLSGVNPFSSIEGIKFVCKRGTWGLNFRINNDETRYRLTTKKIQEWVSEREFVIEEYDAGESQWIQSTTPFHDLHQKIIRVQGILYTTLYLPPIDVPNDFSELFDIHIKHEYTAENYPVYACPVAGVPYDMEVLFPHDCSFVIDGFDSPNEAVSNDPKVLHLTYLANPDPKGARTPTLARRSKTFGYNLGGGGNTRNVETMSVLAALAFLVAFVPRSA